MHSKSPVVNLAEPSWNAFGKQVSNSVQQSIVTDILVGMSIHLLIIHCFNSLQIFWKYKWLHHFIVISS